MPIGLIADLAVGTDCGGSHVWSRQGETLIGLTVGAPPDLLSPRGQDWGLAAFSPHGLRANGFARVPRDAARGPAPCRRRADRPRHGAEAALGGAGGRRRQEGAYLRFPEQDLLRLVALESHRHRAIVLGEDLGTVPEGFQSGCATPGMIGHARALVRARRGPLHAARRAGRREPPR